MTMKRISGAHKPKCVNGAKYANETKYAHGAKCTRDLSAQQQKKLQDTLDFIQSYVQSEGHCPTTRQIMDAINVKSNSTANRYVHMLEELGLIRIESPRTKVIVPALLGPQDETQTRLCIRLEDGGRAYLDWQTYTGTDGKIYAKATGILDATELQHPISRIVGCEEYNE